MNIYIYPTTVRNFGHTALNPARPIVSKLKSLGILRCRGRRGARQKNVTVAETRHLDVKPRCWIINHSNLIYIPCVKTTTTCVASATDFAVPKSLFTNICELAKTMNCVRAPVVLKIHFRNQDIDVCVVWVVSETYLSADVPDVVVNFPEYVIYRRDRGWAESDKKKKGGIAVCVQNNLKCLDIYHSKLCELICLTLLLPSGHCMLICGLYNPPKHSYCDHDLCYLINFVDSVLGKHPDTVSAEWW